MAGDLDFSKYKQNLKAYLKDCGFDVSRNPSPCIAPGHENTGTPAMMLYDSRFECASCGVKGDIYDACGLIRGISDKADQYKEIERHFGGAVMTVPERKVFKIDAAAEKRLQEYLRGVYGREEGVKGYLKKRGCPDEMIESIWGYFGWWPGYSEAEDALGFDLLFRAGIPGKNPKTDSYSWGPSGAVVKLGRGFKLFYYEGKKSKKIASKKGSTFPYPKLPESEVIYLVEGENSAISMRYGGWAETVAVGGVNGLTREGIKQLYRYEKIYIVFDGDAAGERGPVALRGKLIEAGYTGEIIVAKLPAGKDPDDLVKAGDVAAIEKAIAEATSGDDERAAVDANISVPFTILGYDEKAYYFMPKNQNIPLKISRGNTSLKNHMEEIATADWWLANFFRESEDGRITLDVSKALKWLRSESYKRGMYDPDNILGVGPHRDKGRIIINTGSSLLIYGNGEIGYGDYSGKLIFCRSKFKFNIPDDPWTMADRSQFAAQLKTFHFEKTLDRLCVAGFIAIAPFASLLHRCPHIWLTGQRGSGKTFLIDNIIEPALGKFVIKAEGGTSEAGVRQSIGRDCRPVIMDEFEANNKSELPTIESILGLARSAYGGSDKIKGSSGHEAIRFRTKMMFCFSSVKTYLSNAANSSRIAVVRLRKIVKGADKMGRLPEMGGLRRMMYGRLEELIENCTIAKERILDAGYDERTGDTYSPLLAGCWMIVSDEPFMDGSEAQNQNMARAIEQIRQEEQEEDEGRVLDHILQHIVRLDPTKSKTVAEMLEEQSERDIHSIEPVDPFMTPYDDQLRRIGIRKMRKIIDGEEKEVLAISCRHAEIRKIMESTAFTEYRDVLARHPAFVCSSDEKFPSVRMAGKKERVILFDWKEIADEFFGYPAGDDGIPF